MLPSHDAMKLVRHSLAALFALSLLSVSARATPNDGADALEAVETVARDLDAGAQDEKKGQDQKGKDSAGGDSAEKAPKQNDKKARKAEKAKRDAEAREAAKTLHQALKAKEPNARIAALTDASAVDHPTVVAEMAKGLKDDEIAVRRETIQLFGRMESDEALKRLMKFAQSEKRALKDDVDTSVAVIRAIGRHRDPDSLSWLLRGALDGEVNAIRRARLYSAAYQRTPESLEAIFAAMGKCNSRRLNSRMRDLRTSLVWVTGQDQGGDPANWSAWWRKNAKTFKIPQTPPKMSAQMQSEWNNFWGVRREYDRRKKRGDRG